MISILTKSTAVVLINSLIGASSIAIGGITELDSTVIKVVVIGGDSLLSLETLRFSYYTVYKSL